MNLENQQPPPWETAANALSYEPIKARRFTRAEIQTIIKSACESYSDRLQAKIDQNQKSVQWADEMRLALAKELGCIGSASHVVESVQKLRAENAALREQMKQMSDALLVEAEENAALRAQVKRLREALSGPIQHICYDVKQYGVLGEMLQRAIDKALADTQQEAGQ